MKLTQTFPSATVGNPDPSTLIGLPLRSGTQVAGMVVAARSEGPDIVVEMEVTDPQVTRALHTLPPVAIGETATATPTATVVGLAGEIVVGRSPDSVPVGQGINIDALLEGNDTDPRQVVVAVRPETSRNGRRWTPEALRKFVAEVMDGGLFGYKGHPNPQTLAWEFTPPVTHWVGAKEEGGVFYFRGVMDRSADTLKGWIRAGITKTVSVFSGQARVRPLAAGEVEVVDVAQPMSIDWTPPKMAGMNTELLYASEINDPGGPNPVADIQNATVQDIVGELLRRRVEPNAILSETRWTAAEVLQGLGVDLPTAARAIDAQEWERREQATTLVGEIASVVGCKPEELSADTVKGYVDTAKTKLSADFTTRRDKVLASKIAVAELRPIVAGQMADLPETATDVEIEAKVGEIVGSEHIKALASRLGGNVLTTPSPSMGSPNTAAQAPRGPAVRI